MAQHRIYSCDDHLDMNAVPPTLWTDRTPAEHREAVPRVVDKGKLKLWMVGETPVSVSGRCSYRYEQHNYRHGNLRA